MKWTSFKQEWWILIIYCFLDPDQVSPLLMLQFLWTWHCKEEFFSFTWHMYCPTSSSVTLAMWRLNVVLKSPLTDTRGLWVITYIIKCLTKVTHCTYRIKENLCVFSVSDIIFSIIFDKNWLKSLTLCPMAWIALLSALTQPT